MTSPQPVSEVPTVRGGDDFLLARLASHGHALTTDELGVCAGLADKCFRRVPFKPGEVVWCLGVLSRLEPTQAPAGGKVGE